MKLYLTTDKKGKMYIIKWPKQVLNLETAYRWWPQLKGLIEQAQERLKTQTIVEIEI